MKEPHYDVPHGRCTVAEFKARLRSFGIGADVIDNWKLLSEQQLINLD